MRKVKFENTLSYFIPNHGPPKISIRIPESHTLYVCPSACGRRQAIRAFNNGEKNHVSFLYITEADVVSGHYEEIIGDAVEELLVMLESTPKALAIYFNCIDDFLGTDEQSLLSRLELRFPSLRFMLCHINPVAADQKIPPGMRLHNQLYSFLEYSGKKDDGINLIGNYVPLDPESEIFSVLAGWGIRQVRQIIACATFAQYRQLADSRANLVLMPMGRLAAENMAKKLDIPYFFNPISYDIDEVQRNYQSIASLIDRECPDFSLEIAKTRSSIQQALEQVGEMPIIVDSSATMQPFALARALYRYGFQVKAVFAQHIKDLDLADRDWLVENCPRIQIISTKSYEAILGFGFEQKCLTVGFDCAYTLHARHFVNVRHDETFYGFHGIRKLMRLMRQALDRQAQWRHL